MNKMKLQCALMAAVFTFITGSPAMAVESPKYEVTTKDSEFEVRKYAPYIVAETIVDANFDDASNEGFKKLAGYIFGANTSKQKIAMTAPVGLEKKSEKIAMTAPVGQELRAGKYILTFSMPSEYTLESLPIPDDKAVVLKPVAEKTMATIRYSGTWSEERYENLLTELKAWMLKNKLTGISEPVLARYNPPWTLWFMRQNEILIQIENKNN